MGYEFGFADHVAGVLALVVAPLVPIMLVLAFFWIGSREPANVRYKWCERREDARRRLAKLDPLLETARNLEMSLRSSGDASAAEAARRRRRSIEREALELELEIVKAQEQIVVHDRNGKELQVGESVGWDYAERLRWAKRMREDVEEMLAAHSGREIVDGDTQAAA